MERIVIWFLLPVFLVAAPHEPQAVHGTAKVSHPDQNTTVITVSDKAIVQYRHFSILEGEKVQIKHPSTSSISLHRDVGQFPSQIMGELSSNGKIFLVNPNGIVFGPHSKVNVGSLIASTLDIANSDFISGKYRFTLGEKKGAIVHLGEITSKGNVTFISTVIRNQGVIQAPQGQFDMVAGEIVTVDFHGDGKLSFAVEGKLKSYILEQLGKVTANQAMVRVAAADVIIKSVVNTDGFVEGSQIVKEGGVVRIASSAEIHAGKISVQAPLTLMDGTLVAKNGVDFEGAVHLGGSISAGDDIIFGGPVLCTNKDDVFVSTLNGDIRFLSTLNSDAPTRNLFLTAREGGIHFDGPIGQVGPLNSLSMISKSLVIHDMHAAHTYALISSDILFSGYLYRASDQQWISSCFLTDNANFITEGGPLHFQGGVIKGSIDVDTKGGAFSFFALEGTGAENLRLRTGKAVLGEIKGVNEIYAEAEQLNLRGEIDVGHLHLDAKISIFQEQAHHPIKSTGNIWLLARRGNLGTKNVPLDLQTEGNIVLGGKAIFVEVPHEDHLSYLPGCRPPKIFLNGFETFDWDGLDTSTDDEYTTSLSPDLKSETSETPPQDSHVHRRSSPLYYTPK